VQSDRTIRINKLDIIICGNENEACVLIDAGISGDRNAIKIEAEMVLKYKDLLLEIQHIWNVKTKVIPVTVGATGTISKSFTKYLRNMHGKHKIKELQKTAILGTAHKIQKVLM